MSDITWGPQLLCFCFQGKHGRPKAALPCETVPLKESLWKARALVLTSHQQALRKHGHCWLQRTGMCSFGTEHIVGPVKWETFAIVSVSDFFAVVVVSHKYFLLHVSPSSCPVSWQEELGIYT